MKVFFLGTGSAEGLPALFCGCAICREAHRRGGRERRTRSSVLIDDTVKIDLSPDTLANAHAYPQIRLWELRHLLFTHSHDDHFAARELQYLSPNFAPLRRDPLQVWGSADLIAKLLPETDGFFEPAPLEFRPVVPFEEYAVGHLAVTPVTAHHKPDELCLNYLLRDPAGRALLYATDTGWYDPPTWEFLAGVPLHGVVVECGKGESANGYDGHLNLDDAVRFRQRLLAGGGLAPAAPFFLTHLCHTGLLLHEELSERCAPHGIRVAFDGMSLDL
ncbi:MAG TPA: MBL fold metallo-hydrolase [Armatimonadaceae bacterium]|nr:MBL fold metallo-hydrolase [Armatimonadaceae bacterium]